jgi:hypothetical protein
MLATLAAVTLVLTALDHWTTYLCLTQHVPGWQITEGNPLAAWLFASVGLVPGLAIDTAITLCAVAMLVRTGLLQRGAKGACLMLLVTTTALAVVNNFAAIHTLGIPALGRG